MLSHLLWNQLKNPSKKSNVCGSLASRESWEDNAGHCCVKQKSSVCNCQFFQLSGPFPRLSLTFALWWAPHYPPTKQAFLKSGQPFCPPEIKVEWRCHILLYSSGTLNIQVHLKQCYKAEVFSSTSLSIQWSYSFIQYCILWNLTGIFFFLKVFHFLLMESGMNTSVVWQMRCL